MGKQNCIVVWLFSSWARNKRDSSEIIIFCRGRVQNTYSSTHWTLRITKIWKKLTIYSFFSSKLEYFWPQNWVQRCQTPLFQHQTRYLPKSTWAHPDSGRFWTWSQSGRVWYQNASGCSSKLDSNFQLAKRFQSHGSAFVEQRVDNLAPALLERPAQADHK